MKKAKFIIKSPYSRIFVFQMLEKVIIQSIHYVDHADISETAKIFERRVNFRRKIKGFGALQGCIFHRTTFQLKYAEAVETDKGPSLWPNPEALPQIQPLVIYFCGMRAQYRLNRPYKRSSTCYLGHFLLTYQMINNGTLI